jgi:hypothetical protein
MILYSKDPKDLTKKLLDLINTFGNVAGYKTTYKNQFIFYIPTMKRPRKKYENNSLKIKIPRNKLTKQMKDLYDESYKTLKEGIEEDTRRWENRSPVFIHWLN